MSNVHPFPPKDTRYEQAGAWISRLDRGLSEQETRELEAWLSADMENAAVLMSMAELWDDMNALARLADLFPKPAQRPRRSRVPDYAIAATIVVAVAVALWAGLERLSPAARDQPLAETAPDAYETAVGEQSTVMLADGTLVVLNTNSRLRVLLTDEYRLLLLDRGEVNVRVAKDPARPLSLAAGAKVFEAVGTAFNVEINEGHRIELVVTEGKVRVGVRGQGPDSLRHDAPPGVPRPRALDEPAVTVSAGEAWVLSANGEELGPVSPEEIEVRLSWRSGDLIFRGEALEDAVREVGRYTAVEFVILDEELKKVRVAGLFKAGDVDGLLVALRENFNIAYERVDDRTVLLDTP